MTTNKTRLRIDLDPGDLERWVGLKDLLRLGNAALAIWLLDQVESADEGLQQRVAALQQARRNVGDVR